MEIPKGGSRVSKRVIILPVTLGHFPPELQAEGETCFRISVKEGGDSGVLAAAKPQAGHSDGGREEALLLRPPAMGVGADGETPDGIRDQDTKMSPKLIRIRVI